MKEFRTEIKVTPAAVKIDLDSRILTQGSCFADAIGSRLQAFKLKTLVNPFGVIYNPESIHGVLGCSIEKTPPREHTFLRRDDIFLNYNFHSAFSELNKQQLQSRLSEVINSSHDFLKRASWLLITYGTAFVYRRKDTGEIVANCHKMPAALFTKSLLSPEEVVSSFRSFYENLKKFNPGIRMVLSVSPVRHTRDTLVLNNVSKAVLLLACHHICQELNDVEYFPAYEMLMDDLRDYRFYASDMVHPTTDAEDYIWDKFMERYFNPRLTEFVRKWSGIRTALAHAPFHPASDAHQRFLKDLLQKLEELSSLVDVGEEIAEVKRQINTSHS